MTIEKLVRYCLQYLEQDSETDVMNEPFSVLKEDDTFAEYIKNITGSIYMGLVRFATSLILPVKELKVEVVEDSENKATTPQEIIGVNALNGTYIRAKYNSKLKFAEFVLVDNNGRPLAHKIKEVYSVAENSFYDGNIKYMLIGNKVRIMNYDLNKEYYIVYHPTINDLSNYIANKDINDEFDIELNELGVPDEMAINIKYLVFSDMKTEENASLSHYNKNYFESYLNEMQNKSQIDNNIDASYYGWGVDIYGD